VGLDRLSLVLLVVVATLLAGCDKDNDKRPDTLLYGEAAQQFTPISGSVVTAGRVLSGTTVGRRFSACKPDDVRNDATVVERIGVFAESLTFRAADGKTLYSCDGGTDPANERKPPWCGGSAGHLADGKLLDPRLDIICRDREGHPLAYVWIEPIAGARWIGVDQESYVELYEVLGEFPVRVASTRDVDLGRSSALLVISQYDEHGNQLITGKLEARVAG
jgi:hypothetical protein